MLFPAWVEALAPRSYSPLQSIAKPLQAQAEGLELEESSFSHLATPTTESSARHLLVVARVLVKCLEKSRTLSPGHTHYRELSARFSRDRPSIVEELENVRTSIPTIPAAASSTRAALAVVDRPTFEAS